MQTKWKIRLAGWVLLTVACLDAGNGLAQSVIHPLDQPNRNANNDLVQAATWSPPSREQFENAFSSWLMSTQSNPEIMDRVKTVCSGELNIERTHELIDTVIECIAIVRPDVNTLRDSLRDQRSDTVAPNFSSLLDDPSEQKFVRDHVRLFLGRWLAQNEFYDEAIAQLDRLNVEDVLDPMSLLFYRGLMEHQLLKKDECLSTINRLLEHPDAIPRRYAALSRLMLADIQPLESDSLDEISRMMGDIRRRTGLNRSGKLVLGQEEQVIEKLDKLIKKLESQQQAQAAGDNSVPSSPMQESIKASGKGSGQVTSKQFQEGGSWGNLPPAERAAALAEMAKDMPPHYREVIEEYFRRLAKESDR